MPKEIVSQREDTCTNCYEPIYVGTTILYDRDTRSARHPHCESKPRPEPTGDLKTVVEYLRELKQRNEFQQSLLSQYELKGKLSPKQTSTMLRQIKAAHYPGPEVVPAGKYALEVPEAYRDRIDEPWYFVKVWRAPGNPNIVRCYLLHGELEEENEVDPISTLAAIIEAGPADAARAYGRRRGRCSVCEKELRNALSRKLCIGPVCGERFYDHMIWGVEKTVAREWLRSHGIDPTADLPMDVDLAELEETEEATA